jgi:hypothetical protein
MIQAALLFISIMMDVAADGKIASHSQVFRPTTSDKRQIFAGGLTRQKR